MQRQRSRLGLLAAVIGPFFGVGCAGSSASLGNSDQSAHGAVAGRASFIGGTGGTHTAGSVGNSAGTTDRAGIGGSGAVPLGVAASSGMNDAALGGIGASGAGGQSVSDAAGRGGASTAGASGAGGNGNSALAGMGGVAGVPTNAAGSSGTGSNTGGAPAATRPATWDTVKLVLSGTHPPCNSSICHGGSGKVGLGFPVDNDDQLYAVLTQYVSMACDNMVLVVPSHPEESALVKVLKGPCSAQVPRMPNGCTEADGNCVPDDYIAAVEQWVANGAMRP